MYSIEYKDDCENNDRIVHSIIVLWMLADFFICIFSIVSTGIDFYCGKWEFIYTMRQYIMLAKRNTLKKFRATEGGERDFTFKNRIREKLYEGLEGNAEKDPETEEEWKKRERRAANCARMSKNDVLENCYESLK